MSLDNLKKKTKLSLDDMIDNQDVGNPEIRKEIQKEDKEPLRGSYHFPSHSEVKEKEKMDCKLTFNVNSDTFKAFNEIYAQRIIEGEKTEKSVLICEAIKLLYDYETEKRKRRK